jgi:O-Antigen ligase
MSIIAHPASLTRFAEVRPRAVSLHDWYCCLLCVLLAGYATFGKGFACLGIPPLFIGEIVLLLGLFVIIRSDCWMAMLTSAPSRLLTVLLALVIVRTGLDFETYSMDGARDSVIVVYGLFAFIVIALLLEPPDRFPKAIALYSRFAWFYGLAGMALVTVNGAFGHVLPHWPMSGIVLVYLRLGEGAVHMTGAVVFVLLGLRKVRPAWVIIVLLGIGTFALSRAALLSLLVPVVLAAVLGRQRKRVRAIFAVAGLLFGIAYAADLNMTLPGDRMIGPQQIVHDIESLFGQSDEANLDGTKRWRLNWWNAIVGYTLNGPYFWAGKGFGVNLAEADGFVVGTELGGPPLRSPHNANMTILARTGTTGLLLWLATLAAWFGMLLRTMVVARRRGDVRWADTFLWIACYGTAMLIDASFDVALEGPMLGIWFWSVFGFGIAATMIYRAAVETVQKCTPGVAQLDTTPNGSGMNNYLLAR